LDIQVLEMQQYDVKRPLWLPSAFGSCNVGTKQ